MGLIMHSLDDIKQTIFWSLNTLDLTLRSNPMTQDAFNLIIEFSNKYTKHLSALDTDLNL